MGTDDTLPRIYFAGPKSKGANPSEWHETVMATDYAFEAINAVEIHDEDGTGQELYRRDLEATREADGVLLHRVDYHEICGAYIEAGYALGRDDTPTVVWNDSVHPALEFLQWHAEAVMRYPNGVVETLLDAVEAPTSEY